MKKLIDQVLGISKAKDAKIAELEAQIRANAEKLTAYDRLKAEYEDAVKQMEDFVAANTNV